jgi:ABC-type nickel/cobalt efflux system permease component RcnA
MPRRSRPISRHRHTVAEARAQRERVIAVRMTTQRRVVPGAPPHVAPSRHAHEQWDLGCHRAACGVCHPPDPGRRQRTEEAWRRDWDL